MVGEFGFDQGGALVVCELVRRIGKDEGQQFEVKTISISGETVFVVKKESY